MQSQEISSTYIDEISNHRTKLYNDLNEKQLLRYDFFLRSKIDNKSISKISNKILKDNLVCPKEIVLLIGALAKVYIGLLVEEAKAIQREENDRGAIKPNQLYRAKQRVIRRENINLNENSLIFKRI